MSEELFMSEFSEERFENLSKQNGFVYWFATDLMKTLGYDTWTSFSKAINRAMATCNTLNIQLIDNFEQIRREDFEGKTFTDFKLSRVACYLITMNADSKKEAVAKAQVYFATLAGAVNDFIEQTNKVERIGVREEMSEREKSLSGVVYSAGVDNYAFFQNAGYRGMYNKNMTELKNVRSIDTKRSLLDFMGKEELAANLFRLTQTELKIKQDNTKGQASLESVASTVGKQVRKTMIEISGIAPENLPKHEDIKEVKKELKTHSKELKKIDSKKKK